MKEEHDRLFGTIKKEAIKERWKQIQQILIDLKRTQDQFNGIRLQTKSNLKWTEKEKELIIKNGNLADEFTGEYYHDIKNYPELADSASNIIFIKN